MRFVLLAAALALGACDQLPAGTPTEMHTAVPQSLPAFFDCLRERGQTMVSAHRGGAHGQLPEQSLHAFEFTLWDAPVFLEIDVRAARDGLVIMHDETVDRTTDGQGPVSSLTVDQVRTLTLRGNRSDEHPPSLREALDWARGKTVLELDIKQDVRFEDLIAEVREAGAMDRVVFVTYSIGAAGRFARLAPEAMLYVTIHNTRDLDELERRGVDLRHVVAWTGDDEPDPALNHALAARGVETRFGMFEHGLPGEAAATGLQGISTDYPASAVAAFDAADGADGYGALQCLSAR